MQPETAQPETPPTAVLESVSRSFGSVVAVQDVSLKLAQGSILGLVGPSGSGKTTLVRLVAGILGPNNGRLKVFGEDPRRFHRRTRERIGYMPQVSVRYPDLTVDENVSFMASLYGLFRKQRRKRVREVLETVGLWDVCGRRSSDLSGGMQRRLELACALVHDPALLLIDEPTAGVDPLLREDIWAELRRLRDQGRTLFVTTQYVGEAEHCDQVAVLNEGRIAAFGTPDDLRREVFGGDVLEVRSAAPLGPDVLRGVPGVLAVYQPRVGTLIVTVEDAAVATPRIIEAVTRTGGKVSAMHEYTPTFDEVFVALIERARDRSRAAA